MKLTAEEQHSAIVFLLNHLSKEDQKYYLKNYIANNRKMSYVRVAAQLIGCTKEEFKAFAEYMTSAPKEYYICLRQGNIDVPMYVHGWYSRLEQPMLLNLEEASNYLVQHTTKSKHLILKKIGE